MDKIKVSVTCKQSDENGKEIFRAEKTEIIKAGKVDNFNMSKLIVNLLFLSIDLAKLTNDKKNKPKLSQPIAVEYSINGKLKAMNVKFSMSEKRIEVLSDKMPGIMLQSYRLFNLSVKNERFTNRAGVLTFAEITPKKRRKLATVPAEQLS